MSDPQGAMYKRIRVSRLAVWCGAAARRSTLRAPRAAGRYTNMQLTSVALLMTYAPSKSPELVIEVTQPDAARRVEPPSVSQAFSSSMVRRAVDTPPTAVGGGRGARRA